MDEKENDARPATDSMASQVRCFYPGCVVSPKWSIESTVKQRNPDGSPLTLQTCDDHYNDITSDMRRAGTRYVLHPIDQKPEDQKEDPQCPLAVRLLLAGVTVVIALIIGPFIVAYYGVKAVFGWRPPAES